MVMAYIYAMVGEYEAALEEFDLLLSIPSHTSLAWLEADPLLEPMRNHPKYKGLLVKYAD